MKKSLFFAAGLILLSLPVFSQEENTEESSGFFINADFVSRYVWRGQQFGHMSIQPLLEYAVGGFSIGTFGSASVSSEAYFLQEADLYISYTFSDLVTITLSDFFFPIDFEKNQYFNYNQDETKHLYEAAMKFNGTENIPFRLLLAANFYGADARDINNNLNYSTYAELGFFRSFGPTEFSAYLGASLNTPGDDLPSFYGNTEPNVVNLGIKASQTLKITDYFSLPVYTSLVVNPDSENIWLIFGLSISN